MDMLREALELRFKGKALEQVKEVVNGFFEFPG